MATQPDDGDEVWFEADALARSSSIELLDGLDGELALAGLHPGPGAAALRDRLDAPSLGLGTLPSWSAGGAALAASLDAYTGGVRPGWIASLYL